MENIERTYKQPHFILANCIRTPDGTYLRSYNRHHYNQHWDENGLYYAVDGGLDYLKRIGPYEPGIAYEECSVYDYDSHDKIRANFSWGSYGKDGKQPFRYIFLKDMEDEHIKAVLATQTLHPKIKKVFNDEIAFRTTVNPY